MSLLEAAQPFPALTGQTSTSGSGHEHPVYYNAILWHSISASLQYATITS